MARSKPFWTLWGKINQNRRFCVFIIVKKINAIIAFCLAAMILLSGCSHPSGSIGKLLPSFDDVPLISGKLPENPKSVTLLHFFTTTSIASRRLAKNLESLTQKYAPKGLGAVFVCIPEYEYTKDVTITSNQINELGLQNPVLFDNKYSLWSGMLVTKCGTTIIAKDKNIEAHFGPNESLALVEGSICDLLETENKGIAKKPDADSHQSIQCGYLSGGIGNCSGIELEKVYMFNDPKSYKPGKLYLNGEWFLGQEMAWHSSSRDKGSVNFSFEGREVFVTMRSQRGGTSQVTIWLDGEPVPDEFAGEDVANSRILVSEGKPYNIIKNLNKSGQHVIAVESSSSDWAIYNVEIF